MSPGLFRNVTATLATSFAVVSCGAAATPEAHPPSQATCPCPGPASAPPSVVTTGSPTRSVFEASPLTDEGMWLPNDFPKERVAQLYNFTPTDEWLDHARLSSVRLAAGCSGSFVSPSGLVMTNHHCAHSCIEQLSTAKKDFVKDGFFAKAEKDEVKCPTMEINQLTRIGDVTARVEKATAGLSDKAFHDAQRAVIATIEKECGSADNIRCDVVDLYHGGRFHLYTYRRYQDVRLVFAPEMSIAFFGGDPDNFNFPRFDLDVSFVRVYDEGKPLVAKDFFKWSDSGAKEGDLTFVSGHPGGTSRQLTLSQLLYLRDFRLPRTLQALEGERGGLLQFMKRGPEQKRIAEATLFGIENSLKAYDGERMALIDPDFLASKERDEKALRAAVAGLPELEKYRGAWAEVEHVQEVKRAIAVRYIALEGGFTSQLFEIARALVRAGDEGAKKNDERLDEFADARLPSLRQELLSTAPIAAEFETFALANSLLELRRKLGADDPVVRKVLGNDEVNELAARLVKGTKLFDVKARKALWDGGAAAIKASNDPLIALARLFDPDAREVRKALEDHVTGPEGKFGEQIAKAKFAVYGTHTYPDATFSLRFAFGHVAGWAENGKPVSAFTTLGGAFDRATGKEPFALPPSWLAAKSKLDLSVPFNMATTNDIVGGNSGSPVVNKNGEIVGLMFDGNIHSLGGEFGYEPKNNRAVALTSQGLLYALDKIYGATRVVRELHGM